MQRPIFDHHIVNVVYTMDVGTALNLWAIYRCTKNCEYNPNRFGFELQREHILRAPRELRLKTQK